ncbi:hypothetical protein EUGRSUZ_E01665 [Eucalyptus grandis]|uniref:Uncharacterized protein n=2 Tax=Eucalyptus grandis TaxID=71139 RepID=A0ACC3KUM0_EUCGR|nr:hypothetical protein EUGRSUZ_E01665 [Eucalyptus grandis]
MSLLSLSLTMTDWVLRLYISPRKLKPESHSNQTSRASANCLCASRRRMDTVTSSTLNNSTFFRPNALSSNVNGR